MAMPRGRERAPSHNAYRGAAGTSRQTPVLVTAPSGDLVAAKVWVAVDVVADPELGQRLLADGPERALNAVRTPDGGSIVVSVPVVYHDPATEVFALVLPESDRHRELEARAQLYGELARDTSAPVPAYVRDFAVVFGPAGLRAHLERLAERSLAEQRAADLERERAAHERRRVELTAREAELERRQAEVDRRGRELDRRAAEIDVAGADLSRKLAEAERVSADLDRVRAELDRARVGLDRSRRVTEAPPAPPAPAPRKITESPFDEPTTAPATAIPVADHPEEVTSPFDIVQEIDAPALPASADPVTTTTADAALGPTTGADPWADGFAAGTAASAITLEDGRVRAAVRIAPDSAATLVGGALDVRLQVHRMPAYPVVSLLIGSAAALRGIGPAHRELVVFDIGADADRKVLAALARDFTIDVELWLSRSRVRRVRVRAPLAENVGYALRAATDHLRGIPPAQQSLARAVAAITAPDHDLLGLRHDEHGEFRVDKLEPLATANQVRRAMAIARRFTKPSREDYLVTVRGFPLTRWRELRTEVLARAVALGLWMGPELAQVAVSEGLARSRKDLLGKLEQGFAALLGDAVANDLDPDAIEDNRAAIAGEAAGLGVGGAVVSELEPVVSGTIASRPSPSPRGKASVPELIAQLDDRTRRVDAALELCERGDPSAIRPIMHAVRRMARSEAVRVLGTMVKLGPAAAPALTAGLSSSKAYLRHGCALALALLRTEEGTEAVVDVLLSEPTEIWREIARAVGHIGPPALMPLAARLGRLGERAAATDQERLAWAMAHVGVRGGRTAIETLAAGQSAVAPVARMALERMEPAARDDVRPGQPAREVTVNRQFSRKFFEALERGLPELAATELEAMEASTPMELLDDDDLVEDVDDEPADEAELDESDLLPG